MSFLDKVKAQTEQLAQKAQHGVAKGQAKLDQMTAKKQADALLRDLGAAYYAQQRSGGGDTAVTDALAKVDAHVAEHGPIDARATAPAAPQSEPDTAPAPTTSAEGTPTPQPPSSGAPTGNYSLDDV